MNNHHASISANKRSDILFAIQRAKLPFTIKCAFRLGEHKWTPLIVKEYGFGIEEAVTFASFSASRVYRDFHPLPISERDSPLCDGIPIAEAVTLEIHPVRTEEVVPLFESRDWNANRLALLVHAPEVCLEEGGCV